jgi:hypothetical protein
MSKPPATKPATKSPGARPAPRKLPVNRRPAPGGKGRLRQGLETRAWGGGPSWLGVAIIVLSVLVILPIAAAVLGDIWAVILGALIGGFALGRATAR